MQPVQSGGTDGHVDSCFGATSMKLEDERAIVSRKKLYLRTRRHEAVMARGADARACEQGD